MTPTICPSPGCKYSGVMAIHLLNISTCTPKGHMTSGEMVQSVADTVEAEQAARELDSTILEVNLPTSLFVGMPVNRISRTVFEKLCNLLTYEEGLKVRNKQTVILHSPEVVASPSISVVTLTIRWPQTVQIQDEKTFWALINRHEAVQQAEEVKLMFPNHVEVVLKDRIRRVTDPKMVPVP